MQYRYYSRVTPVAGYFLGCPEIFTEPGPGLQEVSLAEAVDAQRLFEASTQLPKIAFRLDIEEEETRLRGYFSKECGHGPDGVKLERSLQRKLDNGNPWAWGTIHVELAYVTPSGTWLGDDYLGCSSYESAQDFINQKAILDGEEVGGYWDDMREKAFDDLNRALARAGLDTLPRPENWDDIPTTVLTP